MQRVDLVVETPIKRTPRVIQLEGMFDVPPKGKLSHEWHLDVPIDEKPWNVGLIVGPSGAGKSSIARSLFGDPPPFKWTSQSVIDDFSAKLSMEDIANACGSVGFNTIPSWMKPFRVLSTGEQFRVQIARALLERKDPIVIDEFTSVVDRQVARIGSHAVQKFIRKQKRKFVAVSCHYDIVDWLQPDWVMEPATMTFKWRSLQRRPEIKIEIARVDIAAWQLFAPYHYLTAELHRGARCFVLFADGQPASFAAVLHRPHSQVDDIKGVTRGVTLPDYQGVGFAMLLFNTLGALYRTCGLRLCLYPSHPAFVRMCDRSPVWKMKKPPGQFGQSSRMATKTTLPSKSKFGGRPCAVFEYAGASHPDASLARELVMEKGRTLLPAP